MGLFTPPGLPPLVTIHTYSPECMGPFLKSSGSTTSPMANAASASIEAANRVLYLPFTLGTVITAVQLFSLNGSTAAGNIDMGIYDAAGNRRINIGATAQSGTSVVQAYDITDTLLEAGRYFLAVVMDGATGTLFNTTIAGSVAVVLSGKAQQASATLPATATFAAPASGKVPIIGLSTRTVL